MKCMYVLKFKFLFFYSWIMNCKTFSLLRHPLLLEYWIFWYHRNFPISTNYKFPSQWNRFLSFLRCIPFKTDNLLKFSKDVWKVFLKIVLYFRSVFLLVQFSLLSLMLYFFCNLSFFLLIVDEIEVENPFVIVNCLFNGAKRISQAFVNFRSIT